MTRNAAQRLLAIVGPTATGKSSLAIRLAERLDGEVVNADSRQLYRGMDIGTAKPSDEEQARVRHWLIDVADPDEPFGLGRYLDLADPDRRHGPVRVGAARRVAGAPRRAGPSVARQP